MCIRDSLDQRDHVDRPRRLRQVHHARINPPVRIERKILHPQMLRRLVVSKVVEQDRAQNRALSVYIRRKRADRVIRCGQDFSRAQISKSYDKHYPHSPCECDAHPLENSREIKNSWSTTAHVGTAVSAVLRWRSQAALPHRLECRGTKSEDQAKNIIRPKSGG